jgi:superfamily II DNA or RNA helicase
MDYEEIKARIKKHEGFVPKMYLDSLGKATIGYGHLVTEKDNFQEGIEYSIEELEEVFNEDFKLRDYQIEAIDIIKNNKKNVIINLPTGTGKNSVIIYSMNNESKYLILVPRIILMDQLKNEIIKHNSKMKSKI